jgi:arginine repressor
VAYQTANNSTHVENAPKPSKVLSLLVLVRIRDHDGALCSPKKSSTETKPDTSKDVEARDVVVNRDKKTDSIDAVTNAAKGEAKLDAKFVDKGAAKDTNHSKSAVKCGVLPLSAFRI